MICVFAYHASAQNRAAYFGTFPQYYSLGSIDVGGGQLTVEALIKLNGTGYYDSSIDGYANIVSKQRNSNSLNYVLRPDHGEIVTSNGKFSTPILINSIAKDSVYHVAMVYNGAELKFFINGCLFSYIPATGNLITNGVQTTLGQLAISPDFFPREQFFGYMDEVRIWRRARTDFEIQNNMLNLPSPASQTGLAVYYKFEGNTKNEQGTASLNAVPSFNNPELRVQEEFSKIQPFNFTFDKIDPTCKGNDGSITINAFGGNPPYKYVLDGIDFQTTNVFENLSPGFHIVTVRSGGVGCAKSVNIELADNTLIADISNSDSTITFGSSVQLNGYSSIDNYLWSPAESLSCTDCATPLASPATTTTYYLFSKNNLCSAKDSVTITVGAEPTAECNSLQLGIGSTANERAIDVAVTENYQYFIAANSKSAGGATDILITKHTNSGAIVWSKTFGGNNDDLVQKISATKDGGLLVVGQTKSFGNVAGDILCFKINAAGNIVWENKFGLGSASGDVGMDIIETEDGGYALTGTLNNNSNIADGVVMKLNATGNIVWNKRFDRSYGEGAVGVVQKADTLVVAFNAQNSGANYSLIVMKLNLADGSFIMSNELSPAARGLFNPYIYRNPASPGYIISGHTIDGASYTNMKPTILYLDEALELQLARSITLNLTAAEKLTGFAPLPDGSFIGCASSETSPQGYIYKINKGGVEYAKVTLGGKDKRLSRLATNGSKIVAVGGVNGNNSEDVFILNVDINGNFSTVCDISNAAIKVESPVYNEKPFNWDPISYIPFNISGQKLSIKNIDLVSTDLCKLFVPDFTFDQDVCNPQTVQFKTDSLTFKAFEWNFGNGAKETVLQPLINFSKLATYTVSLSVQNSRGCWDTVSKQIPVNLQLVNTYLPKDSSICIGDSVVIKANSNTAQYCWQPADSLSNTNTLNVTARPKTTNAYYFTAKEKGQNLIQNAAFTAGDKNFSSDYTSSNSGTVAGTYTVGTNPKSWNGAFSACKDHTSGNGAMLIVNGSDSVYANIWQQDVVLKKNTNYVFSAWLQNIASANGAKLKFAINGTPIGNELVGAATVCTWNEFSSVWNSGALENATLSIMNMNTGAGGNDFALDDLFFGEVFTRRDSVKITVVANPTLKVTPDTAICVGTSIQLSAETEPQNTIKWTPAQFLSSTTIAKPIAKPNKSITYYVEVKNATGCSNVDSVSIAMAAQPSITLPADTTVCIGGSITLSASVNNYSSFVWQKAEGLTDTASLSPTVSPAQTTSYILSASNSSCTVMDTVVVKVNALPVIGITNDTVVCANTPVQLSATGGTKYKWTPEATLSSATVANPVARPLTNTLYTVEVTNANSCVQFDSVMVTVQAPPDFKVNPSIQSICLGDTAVLTASGADTYKWSPQNSLTGTNGNVTKAFPTVTTLYKVVFTNAACNYTDSAFTSVEVRPMPTLSVTKSSDIDCGFGLSQLTATSNGATKFQWSPATGLSNTNVPNPVAIPAQTTTYTVTATSSEGCVAMDTITVAVSTSSTNNFNVPNAFTPNNDGKNDCFSVRYWGQMDQFLMEIYDRWGKKVFSTSNATQCWDGRFKGVDQPVGTYVYYIKGKSVCGDVVKKGTITLIR